MDEHGPDELAQENSADHSTDPENGWRSGEDVPETFRQPAGRGTPNPHRRRRPNPAFQQMAARLEDAADRLDQLVDAQFGRGMATGRAGAAAQAASDAIQDVAAYLRGSDFRSVRDDLAERVRTKPLQTTFLALGAGWLAGKILR